MWHTHLKKKLNQTNSETKKRVISKPKIKRSDSNSSTITQSESASACTTSSSDFSSVTVGERKDIKSEDIESMEETMAVIDESFWSEAAALDETSTDMKSSSLTISNEMLPHEYPDEILPESHGDYNSNLDDGMDFWYDIFIRTGDQIELPEF